VVGRRVERLDSHRGTSIKSIFLSFSPTRLSPITHFPHQIPHYYLSFASQNLSFLSLKSPFCPINAHPKPLSSKPHQTQLSSPSTKTKDDGIDVELVKILVQFKSCHNYTMVLQVFRKADHPFRDSRLLLLDGPGNIHSIGFLIRTLTDTLSPSLSLGRRRPK